MTPILLMAVAIATAVAALMGLAGIISIATDSNDWAKNPYGRFVMNFLVSGTLLAGQAAAGRFFGRWPGDLFLLLFAWLGFCLTLSMPLFLSRKARRDARREEAK